MAKKRGSNPYSRVMSPSVYPVVPQKVQLLTATSGTPVFQELDFDLDFTENMLYDLYKLESWFDPTAWDSTVADGNADIDAALLDNATSTINIQTEAVFETDPSILYYHHATFNHETATAVGQQLTKTSDYHIMEYPEPITFARNVQLTLVMTQTTAIFTGAAITGRFILWGRKRKAASDREYKDIMIRQSGL